MKYFSKFSTQPFIVFSIFFIIVLLIVLFHLLFHPIRVFGMDTSIFYMDEKYTLAAYFSTITAFIIGFLALTNISKTKSKLNKLSDISFGLFFLILSFDEYFEVHEHTNTMIKNILKTDNLLASLAHLSWIFPLSIIIFFVFFLLIIKIKNSSKVVRLPFIFGCVSFGTVLIFEILGSSTYGQNIYLYYVAAEEGLEMIGVTFFLLGVLIENEKK